MAADRKMQSKSEMKRLKCLSVELDPRLQCAWMDRRTGEIVIVGLTPHQEVFWADEGATHWCGNYKNGYEIQQKIMCKNKHMELLGEL